MIGLYVDHIHPDIPIPEGLVIKACIRGVIDLVYKIRDQFDKQAPGRLGQLFATLGEPELVFEVATKA